MNIFKTLRVFFASPKQDLRDVLITQRLQELEKRKNFLTRMYYLDMDIVEAIEITAKDIESLQGELSCNITA